MGLEQARRLLARLHAAQGAFYAGGPDLELRELLADDVQWHVPGANAIAGDYRGIEQVMDYFARRRELASRTFKMHPGEILAGDGPHVAALTDGTALIAGEQRHWSTVGLYRFRGELLAACWLLPLDPREFDSVWSAARG